MTCELVQTPTGPIIRCTTHRIARTVTPCEYCGAEDGRYLCDAIVTRSGGYRVSYRATCDRAMCVGCTRAAGYDRDLCLEHRDE